MARNISDVLRIMRLAIGRRNENDPDSNDGTLLQYINDFATLSMSDDVKLFENFRTLSIEIDETNTEGVYIFPDDTTSTTFVNLSSQVIASLTDPVDNSVSWNELMFFEDPGQFYMRWGINNTDVLIPGFPTEVLFHGNQLVFRTIPDTSYTVNFYGYIKNSDYTTTGDPEIQFDYWLRYLAYGAALQYATDYQFEPEVMSNIDRSFKKERRLVLTRTHNQRKTQRCYPRF